MLCQAVPDERAGFILNRFIFESRARSLEDRVRYVITSGREILTRCVGVIRPAREHLLITGERILSVAQILECAAEAEPTLHVIGIEPHRLAEQAFGLLNLASLRDLFRKPAARGGHLRVVARGTLEAFNGVLELACFDEQVAEIEPRVRARWIDLERLLQRLESRLLSSKPLQRSAEIVPSVRV